MLLYIRGGIYKYIYIHLTGLTSSQVEIVDDEEDFDSVTHSSRSGTHPPSDRSRFFPSRWSYDGGDP